MSKAIEELKQAIMDVQLRIPFQAWIYLKLKINAVCAEAEAWEKGCRANADDAKDCHRRADNQRLELLALRAELRPTIDLLTDMLPIFCEENQPIIQRIAALSKLESKSRGMRDPK